MGNSGFATTLIATKRTSDFRCPHCAAMRLFEHMEAVDGAAVRGVLRCPSCQRLCRDANWATRLMGATLMVGFFSVLAMVAGTGGWMIVSAVELDPTPVVFLGLGVGLLGVGLVLGRRVFIALRNTLSKTTLLPYRRTDGVHYAAGDV